MRKIQFTQRNIIPPVAILGFIGLAALAIKPAVGAIILVLPVVLLAITALQAITSQPAQVRQEQEFDQAFGELPLELPAVEPHPIQIKTIYSEFEQTQPPAVDPTVVLPKLRTPVPVQPDIAEPLLAALRTGGFTIRAIVASAGQTPITVTDVFTQIAEIMKERGDNIQEMAPAAPEMYPLIWNYGEEAERRYADPDLVKLHIASSAYFKYKAEHTNL